MVCYENILNPEEIYNTYRHERFFENILKGTHVLSEKICDQNRKEYKKGNYILEPKEVQLHNREAQRTATN